VQKRFPAIFSLTLLVAGAFIVAPAAAEEGTVAADAAEELLFQEISSVYTASKYEQKVTEAPARVTIVTAEEISRFGHRTLADVLRGLSGFYVSYDRNYSYVGVRGFGLPGDYNTRILLLVDGHRMNDNIYDSAMADTAFGLDLDLVQLVEVVRGPSSSLYGSNAFFAVINVITRKGRDLAGTEASVTAASHESYKGRLSYGTRYAGGLEVLLSGTVYDSEGKSSLYYPEFDSPATNNGVFVDGDDDRFENFFAKLSYGGLRFSALYSEREKGVPTAPWGVEFNDPDTRTWDGRFFMDLNYQQRTEGGIEVAGRLFYDRSWYDGDYVFDYGPPPDIVTNKDETMGSWWGTEIMLSRQFFEVHHLSLGGEYRDNIRQQQRNFDRYGVWLDSDVDIDSWAVFLQDAWNLTDSLLLNVGLRYDRYESFGGATNPRLALIYSPLAATTLKLLYGEAFRAPNVYELYYHDGYLTAKPNPSLDPESIASLELVWEQQLNSNMRTALSLYRNEIEDLLTYTLDSADGLYTYKNMDDAEAFGMEISLDAKWNHGWQLNCSYTWQQAEESDGGARLVNSPRHMAKATVLAPLVAERLLGGLELQYESGRKTVAGDETQAILLTNLSLTGPALLPGLTMTVGVHNLFDVAYDFPGSAEHRQDMIRQDGQTFWLKIEYLLQ
jgi:iron complex outermembrane receptor protein